jgi:enoyl-CoA hydratase/carnithine racemase
MDAESHAIVLTGTGDSFMDQIDGPSLGDITDPLHWEKIRVEGLKILQRLVELPMPVVGVANGPTTVHSEYLLLADVHIASERVTYGDSAHPGFGITGGDNAGYRVAASCVPATVPDVPVKGTHRAPSPPVLSAGSRSLW